MARPTPEQRMEAYADALHEAVGALATLKYGAIAALETGIPLDPAWVVDVASGKLEHIRTTTR